MKLFTRITIHIALLFCFNVYAINANEELLSFNNNDNINPFTLPSWGLSYSQYKHEKILNVTGEDPKNTKTSNKILTLTLDKAMYKKYLSYELNFSGLYNFDQDETQHKDDDGDAISIPKLVGIDTMFAVRGKVPIEIGFAGDIALTAAGGIGFSAILMGSARSDVANKEGEIIWSRAGLVANISYGIHYFPSKWFAIILEFQNRFYRYNKDTGSKNMVSDPNSRYKKSFNFSTGNMLSIGFKTTI
ncbi:MAG: hypothetical protein HRT87_07240 [Legionellales bacterium]|nr:hypothetical protein [Legionellales bacterium]